jgi:hypothetical protein
MFDAIDRRSEDDLHTLVDTERLERHVDRFADLRRYPGSEDQWTAAEYVANTLEGYGADVTLHTVEAYTSVPEEASVTVTSPRHETIDEAITTAFSANTPPSGVSGPVVSVTSATDPGDVADKIVLARGLPTPDKILALESAGARAVVFESPTPGHLHEMIVSPVWGTPSATEVDRLPDLPVAEIGQSDAEWLRTLVTGDDVEVSVETRTRTELTDLPCPVARIDGTESDRYFLVGNHIDAWHEGVTDNATAMVASMELARILAENPPKRGVVFGFWPGHSMGRYAGSSWYADEHWQDLRENGVAYLHIDLNGLEGADELWFQHMAEVEAEHLDALETGPLPLGTKGDTELLGASDRPGRNSDQSFWGTGLSSLLSGARFSAEHEDAGPVGGGWWWHTTADTRDKVDLDLLASEVRLYLTVVSRFCNSPVVPRDFRATCEDLRATLDRIDPDEEAVDFEPVYRALDALEAALEDVTTAIEELDPDDPVDDDLEELQVRLGNQLIPALYMEVRDVEQEPALPHDLLPGLRIAERLPELTGRDRRAAEITVTRGVNRLVHRIETATGAVERYLG